MNTTEIENTLRKAPQPKAPATLLQRRKAQALSAPRLQQIQPPARPSRASWLARWWPTLPPLAVSLACAATLTVQQLQLRRLKTERASTPAMNGAIQRAGMAQAGGASEKDVSAADELARLRDLASTLTAEVAKLEQAQAENEKMRAQLAARASNVFTPEETKAMDEARDKALNIQCVNNLKQLCLAVRVYSMDNHETSPPNVISMSNEMGSFKILVCPADTARQPAADAGSFTQANCSYEYMAPLALDNEPQRIAFRCPIHGNLGLIDGSVQMGIAKNHPNWIVQRNGKYYLESPPPSPDSTPAPEPQPQQ